MQIYDVAHEAVISANFVTALLLALAYARWHYWWRSWFGRSFMILLLAIAGGRLQAVANELGLQHGASTVLIVKWIGFTISSAAFIALSYLLARTVWVNAIRPIQRSDTTADQARRYLARTPDASEQEIKELVACWDRLREGNSVASDQPDHETP